MTLKHYIDLSVLLEKDTSTPQARRVFGLKHEALKSEPLLQLQRWRDEHIHSVAKPLLSEKVDTFLYSATLVVLGAALFLGFFSGVALLSYNGHEPVNLVYFLAMVVFLPAVTITLTLLSMLKANRAKNLLVHISPAFWLERVVALFSKKRAAGLEAVRINPLLVNWIVIKRSQMAALVFSAGLLLALLGVVATKDVVFAWSTTLDVTPEAFHRFIRMIAFPWRSWMPSAVPTLELVQQSHYFRLGGEVSPEMVGHASVLGAWWKFLAMATLFYAIILRLGVWLLAAGGLKRALARSVLTLDGVSRLLREMNEPLITTHEAQGQTRTPVVQSTLPQRETAPASAYDMIQGWSLDSDTLRLLADTLHVSAPRMAEAGGNNTLEADRALIESSRGRVLLFVKAWEPPTMDFMDYLHDLIPKVEYVVVYPVGTPEEGFGASPKAAHVWVRKLSGIQSSKVRIGG
jgi:hypothetical protein